MLGLGSSLLQGGALRSIVRSGLQLFYKADRTQAPLGEEQIRNNSFDEITGDLVLNPTFDLGAEEVQNGTFDLGAEEVQNGGFNELGPDKIDNGNFETNIDGWSPNAGSETTITYNSQLKGIKFSNYGPVGSPTVRNTNSDTVTGETYKLTYKVLENNNASKISIWNGSTYSVYDDLPVDVSNDEHIYYYTFSGSSAPDLYIKLETDESDITLSNIKLEKVDPNNRWDVSAGWSVANNKLNGISAITENSQTIFASASSRMLKITYDLVVDSGEAAVYMADKSKNFISQSGSYTDYITSSATDIRIDGRDSAPFTGSVTNVSVKEVPWVLSGASISDNKCTITSVGGALSYFYQSGLNLTEDKSYNISFKATRISGDTNLTFNRAAGNNISGAPTISSTNEYSFNFTPSQDENGFGLKRLLGGSGAVWEIENFSVKEVPNWELGSGWSVGDGKASNDGESGANNLRQRNILTPDKPYQITIEVSDYVSGNVQVSAGGLLRGEMTADGTYTFNQVANGHSFFIIANSFVGSVSNVSVKQLDPNTRWNIQNPDTSAHTVEIREGYVFIDYDSTGTQGSTGVNINSIIEQNQKYRIETVVDSIDNDGKLKVQIGNAQHALSLGTNIFDLTSTSTGSTISIARTSDGDSVTATVSSVSLRKVTNSIKDHSRNSNDGILYSGKALEFDNEDGTNDYIELNNANLPGEFTVCTWVKPYSHTQCNIFGDTANDNWIRIHAASSITVKIAGDSTGYHPVTHGGNVALNEWSRVVVTRGSDNIIRFGINGVFYSPTDTTRAGNFNFNRLGVKDNLEMNGALADVQVYDKAWNATDVKYDWENPDKDVFHRVGEAQVLGSEEVTNGDFTTDLSSWDIGNTDATHTVIYSNGSARYQSDSTSPQLNFDQTISNVEVGKTYQLSIDVTYTTGRLKVSGIAPIQTVLSNGLNVFNVVADSNTIRIIRSESDVDALINSVSVKEVTTHASHILPTDCKSLLRLNEGAGDRVYDAAPVLGEDLMESRNGSFELGGEEITDGGFPTGTTAWQLINGATISGNKANIIGDGSTFTSIKQTGVFENNKSYKIVADVTVTSGLGLKFQDGATNENIGSATETGIYTFNFTGTGNADLIVGRRTSDTAFNSSVNSISVKEITNWVEANYVELNDSGVFFNNSGDNIFQNFSYIDGATYAIGFEGTSDTGLIRYRTGFAGTSNTYQETPIPGTAIWRPDSTSQRIQLFGPASGTATVSKVTIKLIKPAESFFITGDKNFLHQQPYIPQYAMSSFSKKMLFDGVNDYVNCGSDASIDDIFTGGGTLSCWFSAESDGKENVGTIISKAKFRLRTHSEAGGGVIIQFLQLFNTSNGKWNTDSIVLLNKLNHIAVTYDNSSLSNDPLIYVNGVIVDITKDTSPSGAVLSDGGYNFTIGDVDPSGTHSYDGIIDEVSLFKSELTQDEVLELYNSGSSFDSTGHSKYNLGEEVSNGTLDLGSEEVVDGNFATDSDWELQPGWSVNNNTAVYDGTGPLYRKLIQTLSTVVGRTYQMAFTLSGLSSGDSVNFGLGRNGAFNGYDQKTYLSNGTYTRIMQAQSIDDDIMVQVNQADANCTVSNISVKEIPSWSFGDGWSYVDGKASLVQVGGPQATDYLMQELPGLVDGRTYVVSFDLDITSSTVTTIGISATGAFGQIGSNLRFHETSGRKTFTAIYDSSHQSGIKELRFVGGEGTEFTIDNVSVQEYGVSGYWRNNGADQWDDLSINSNHGTVSGSPTEIFLQEVPFFGKDSLGMFMNKPRLGGLNFHTSGYVNIEDNNDLDFGTGAFTMECWVTAKYESQGSSINVILSLGGNGAGSSSAALVSHSTNKLGGYVGGSTLDADSSFTIGDWYHVAIARDGNGLCTLYIDSEAQSDTETNQNNITNSDVKFIGRSSWNVQRDYNGIIDDVKIYNKALTQAEIKKNYNATKGKHKN